MEPFNLLIIDDDPNIRKLLNELLAGRPEFHLLIAEDGREAVRHFAANRIDMVLTDIHMPGFTGLELMADMKKINFKPEILVMTANATPENVETARKIGARSVILKPFDDLEVIEAEINKALQAAKAARGRRKDDGNGHGASPAVASPGTAAAAPAAAPPAARPAPQASPPPAKAPIWPAPKPPAAAPVRMAPPEPESAGGTSASQASSGEQMLPDLDTWRGELTGNDTPPAPPREVAPAAPPRKAAPPSSSQPVAAATPKAAPATPPPAPAAAQPHSRAVPAPAARETPHPAPHPAPPAPGHPETVRSATGEGPEEEVPDLPSDLEAIFRTATSFDAGRMHMQVPIICLQTWEEKGAIAALRRLAASQNREFYTWSSARGLVRDGGQAMGETYRDAARALEFVRRQKNNGIYVLADFRPCLEDKTVVRLLREMVMELETARLMLVLTAPRLLAPPELAQACVAFDWPAGGGSDPLGLYQEVVAEVAASTGRVVRLDPAARDLLLKTVREMPAGRARFEIARALLAAKPRN
jgi:CheY-like chemotaxis protein